MRMQVAVLVVALAACVLGDKSPSGQVISRTVSVKSPERRSNVISHFTPADHRYEATGSVLIAPEVAEASRPIQRSYGPPAATQRVQSATPSRPALPAAKASGAALTRTVKVRTPVRVPSVISHFVPADHRYEAEGSVTIVKGSGASARGSSSGSGAATQFVSQPAPARKVKVERKFSGSSQASSSSAAAAASAANLALTRTVSVKSPERVSNVISHFLPADHRYEATGSVTIVKGSQSSARGVASGSTGQAQFVSRPAPRKQPAPARRAPVVPAPAPKVRTSQFSGGSSSGSNLALTRTVSVKSPERIPTVISHFVPAEHRYEATGSVTIVKGASGASRGASLSGSSASQAQFVKRPAAPAPAPKPARVASPVTASVRQVKKISRPTQTASAASSAANLALTRTVSVKSPERVSNVISHFVPADHRYEATGSVTIVKGSQGATRRVSSGSSSAGAQFKLKPAAIPVPVPAPAAPKASGRVEAVRKASSASSGNLALTRTVSVKSPERQPTVISHFVPAEHQYEATGSVTIVKGSSGGRQSAGFGQALSSSGRRVSGSSSSLGASTGSSFSSFGQASGSAAGKASGSQAAFGQSQSGSFGASASRSASGKASGRASFSSSGQTTGKQESFSASRKAAASGQAASGRVSFGAGQTASSSSFGQASGSASQAASSAAFGQTSGSSSRAASISASKKASASRAESSSARRQSSASASASQSSAYGASASSQRSQPSTAAARESSSESFTYRLAEPFRGGSSVSAAELLTELKAFREEAARSGVKISQTRQSGRDDDGSGSDPYNFSIRVQDSSSTNYQSRDEWVGADGVTYGWYTMLMPDGFFYNYTYTSHPVKGYQVKVTREDSGISLKPVEADIFAPATVFSNQGIGRFADFAISGVNNDYQEPSTMNYEENAAAMFADSFAEAQKVQKSSSTRAAVSSGPPSHICGHRIIRERGSRTSGSKTLEGLVFGPCTYTQEAVIRRAEENGETYGSASRGSFASSGSASGFSAQGAASTGSSFAGKASGSASRFSSSSGKLSSSGSSSSGASAAFASKASSSASQSASQSSGSTFGASSKASGSAFGSSSASRASDSAFGSSTKGFGSASARKFSGSSFESTSQGSGSASASKASGSAFSSASQGFGSGSTGKLSGSAFESARQASGSAIGSKASGSAFGFGSQSSGSASASKFSGSASGSSRLRGSSGSQGASTSFFQSSGSAASSGGSGSAGSQFFGSAGTSRQGSSKTSGSGRLSSGFAYQASSSPSSSEENKSSGFFKVVREESGPIEQNTGDSFSRFQSSSSSVSSGFSSSSRNGGIGSSGGSLTRTVSVKSPVRHSSVISHFVPADHIYDATAGVTLGSSSVKQTSTPSRSVFVSAKSEDSDAAARKAAEAALAAASRAAAARSSKLALTRTVAVKSPERHTSVISHFVPAEHRYEAVGSVTINRESEKSTSSVSPVRTFTVKSSAPVPARPRVPSPAPAPGYGTPSRSASPSNLSLTRTVSVKSPERKSSVISHFTPAEHKYEATGSVTINRSSD